MICIISIFRVPKHSDAEVDSNNVSHAKRIEEKKLHKKKMDKEIKKKSKKQTFTILANGNSRFLGNLKFAGI